MSRFVNELNARISKQMRGKKFTRVAILDDDLCYQSDIAGDVIVPLGFASDGASVPRFLWSMFPPFGKYLEAAFVHDWFCVTHAVDSVTAAKVFREAMEVCGVGKWRRNKMYWAVRLGGPKFKMNKSETLY
jgi:hypothetical protein